MQYILPFWLASSGLRASVPTSNTALSPAPGKGANLMLSEVRVASFHIISTLRSLPTLTVMSPPKSLTNAHHAPPGTGVTVTGGMSSPATSLGEKTLLQSIPAATVVSALPDADAFAGPPPGVAAASVRDGEHAIVAHTAQAMVPNPIPLRNMTSSWWSVTRSRVELAWNGPRTFSDGRYLAVSATVTRMSPLTPRRAILAAARPHSVRRARKAAAPVPASTMRDMCVGRGEAPVERPEGHIGDRRRREKMDVVAACQVANDEWMLCM